MSGGPPNRGVQDLLRAGLLCACAVRGVERRVTFATRGGEYVAHQLLPSFAALSRDGRAGGFAIFGEHVAGRTVRRGEIANRKSTRLNSSHVKISYAVFC